MFIRSQPQFDSVVTKASYCLLEVGQSSAIFMQMKSCVVLMRPGDIYSCFSGDQNRYFTANYNVFWGFCSLTWADYKHRKKRRKLQHKDTFWLTLKVTGHQSFICSQSKSKEPWGEHNRNETKPAHCVSAAGNTSAGSKKTKTKVRGWLNDKIISTVRGDGLSLYKHMREFRLDSWFN